MRVEKVGSLGGLPGLAAGGVDFDQVRRRGELSGFALFWGFPPAPHSCPVRLRPGGAPDSPGIHAGTGEN